MKSKIGVDTILIIVAIIIVAIFLILAMVGRGEPVQDDGSGTSSLSQVIQRANDADLMTFNAKFKGYEGTQKGTVLKALISAVENNNSSGDRQILLIGGDNIDNNSTYTVSFNYDSEGYINTVTITLKK